MKFDRPLKDYKGYKLCTPCWNGFHWHDELIRKYCKKHKANPIEDDEYCPDCTFGKGTKKVQDCLGPPCECPCVALRNERHPRVKPDHSLQMDIDMTNPIQIGKKETTHNDQ